jgi:hypothetical protein
MDHSRATKLQNLAWHGGGWRGDREKLEDQPHAKQLAHAPQPPMWSPDKEGEPVPVTGNAERPLPDARRNVAGRSKRVTRMPSSTAAIQRKQSRPDAGLRSCCGIRGHS